MGNFNILKDTNMKIKVLKSNVQSEVIAVESLIMQNSGIPNSLGTAKWAEIQQHPDGFFYIIAPSESGWGGVAYSEMMTNVTLPIVEIELQDESEYVDG
jgi:hypothetical protein